MPAPHPFPLVPNDAPAPAYCPPWWRRARQTWRRWTGDAPLGYAAATSTSTQEENLEACWGATTMGGLRPALNAVMTTSNWSDGVGTLLLDRLAAVTAEGPGALPPHDAGWTAVQWLAWRQSLARSQDGRWLQLAAHHAADDVLRACTAALPYPTLLATWQAGSPTVRHRVLEGVLAHPDAAVDDTRIVAEDAAALVWAAPGQMRARLHAVPGLLKRRAVASAWLVAGRPEATGPHGPPCEGHAPDAAAVRGDAVLTLAVWADTAAIAEVLGRWPAQDGPSWRALWSEWRVRVAVTTTEAMARQSAAVCAAVMDGVVRHAGPEEWQAWLPRWTAAECAAVMRQIPARLRQLVELLWTEPDQSTASVRARAGDHWQWAVAPDAPAWSAAEATDLLQSLPAMGALDDLPSAEAIRTLCRTLPRKALDRFLATMMGYNRRRGGAAARLQPTEIAAFLVAAWPSFVSDPMYRETWESSLLPTDRGVLFTPATAPALVVDWWPDLARVELARAAAVLAHCSAEAIAALQLSTVDLMALLQLADPAARMGAVAAMRGVQPTTERDRPAPTTYQHPTMPHAPLPAALAVHHPAIREGLAALDPAYQATRTASLHDAVRRRHEAERQEQDRQAAVRRRRRHAGRY